MEVIRDIILELPDKGKPLHGIRIEGSFEEIDEIG